MVELLPAPNSRIFLMAGHVRYVEQLKINSSKFSHRGIDALKRYFPKSGCLKLPDFSFLIIQY
jgi:hypothetical protein